MTALVEVLPDWMPADAWEAFLDMRKRKRAVPSPHAERLLIRELDKLRVQGCDPRAVLERSTMNNYTGLFPLTDDRKIRVRGDRQRSRADEIDDAAEALGLGGTA